MAEAINALCKLRKNLFKPNLIEGTRPMIRVLGFETVSLLFEKSETRDLHIVPAFSGGKSALISILVGAALIALSFTGIGEILLVGAGALGAGSAAITVGSILFGVGVSVILGGLTQLLFPTKLADQKLDDNNYLGAPGNTVAAGTRIPLIFGTVMVYGHYLSENVDAVNI